MLTSYYIKCIFYNSLQRCQMGTLKAHLFNYIIMMDAKFVYSKALFYWWQFFIASSNKIWSNQPSTRWVVWGIRKKGQCTRLGMTKWLWRMVINYIADCISSIGFSPQYPEVHQNVHQVVRKIKEGCVWIEILLRGQSPEGVGSGHWGRSHWKVDETLACHGCRRSSHKGNLDPPIWVFSARCYFLKHILIIIEDHWSGCIENCRICLGFIYYIIWGKVHQVPGYSAWFYLWFDYICYVVRLP